MENNIGQLAVRVSLLGLFVLTGCGLGAEDNFTRGLDRDRCEGTFPICSTAAGCVMGRGRYLEGRFPGTREFIVPAPEESFITVQIFFRTQLATGESTRILWNEPGCVDTYEWDSEGQDIFLQAGNDKVLEQTRQVFFEGDHLIEVSSDALAEYFIAVEVDTGTGG